jgi:hypothetical protein
MVARTAVPAAVGQRWRKTTVTRTGPVVAANKGGPKEQHKDDKRPNAKKDPKKEGKKEHEGEPGR